MQLTQAGIQKLIDDAVEELAREIVELRAKIERLEERAGPDSESWRY